jgi:hypothetical protein
MRRRWLNAFEIAQAAFAETARHFATSHFKPHVELASRARQTPELAGRKASQQLLPSLSQKPKQQSTPIVTSGLQA